MSDKLFENRPLLAVVGGRFLPVEEINIEKTTQAIESSPTSPGGSAIIGQEEKVFGDLSTRRQPKVTAGMCGDVLIYDGAHKLVLNSAVVSSTMKNSGETPLYRIELVATSTGIRAR